MAVCRHPAMRPDQLMRKTPLPDFPIIDSHVHLYDVDRLSYSWLASRPAINHSHFVPDYLAQCGETRVEKLVFAEVWIDAHLNLQEAEWVSEQAARYPVIQGMIAAAPLERGAGVEADLDVLAHHPTLRAIRRITELEADPAYCLRADFIEGVRRLGERGLVCDICVFHFQLSAVVELVRLCPGTTFVLDHIGKPGIRAGLLDPWRDDMARLARLPNVAVKISGVVTEADHGAWTRQQLRPYLDHAIASFGFDRVLYGSDWPVVNLASSHAEWLDIVDDIVSGCSPEERRKLYRDNALRLYRL